MAKPYVSDDSRSIDVFRAIERQVEQVLRRRPRGVAATQHAVAVANSTAKMRQSLIR
jgi:hypothetical protein